MHSILLWQLTISLLVMTVNAVKPTPTKRTSGPSSQFVTSQNGQLFVNGSQFTFVGTNAYWLPTLNSAQDIDNTLATIAASNITVVRVWGFNDVTTIPQNGTWFQQISNGTITINNGTNGLQKLDLVIQLAQKHGLYVIVSLTNNWNPLPNDPLAGTHPQSIALVANSTLPRNSLSNDYGGMDFYVRQLATVQAHDEFYVNQTIINAFMNYTTQVISRYVNSPAVLSWELANDPRCSSSLNASSSCQTTTVTSWHSTLAQHVTSVDPNHLVSSGHQGFFCVSCPKLFPRVVPPPPQTSPAPGRRRRSVEPVTRASLLKERKAMWKKERLEQKRSGQLADGIKIRGRWRSTATKRQQDIGPGSSFDGSQGVDGEDIINIPQIGFGSFQLFPDQNTYGPVDPTLPAFNQTVQTGLDWIRRQAEAGLLYNKPVSLIAFGLVTQSNAPFFVPFNSTYNASSVLSQSIPLAATQQPFGVTDQQRDDAYSQWIQSAVQQGLKGVVQYQWGQANLTAQPGTTVSPIQGQTGTSPNVNSTGTSPTDGYSILGQGLPELTTTLQQGAAQFAGNLASG